MLDAWFIGKLQAERDKARVLEGLKGAIAEAGGNQDAVDYDALISQLGSRVFLLHNINEPRPIVFHTRWVHSYLRGPLTRPQVRELMAKRKAATAPPAPAPSVISTRPPHGRGGVHGPHPPTRWPRPHRPGPPLPSRRSASPPWPRPWTRPFPPSICPWNWASKYPVRQLATESGRNLDVSGVQLVYEPAILETATVRYVDRRRNIDEQSDRILIVPAPDGLRGADWASAERLPIRMGDLTGGPERVGPDQGPFFAPTPEGANSAREFVVYRQDLSVRLPPYNGGLTIKVHPDLDVFQQSGRGEGQDFKIFVCSRRPRKNRTPKSTPSRSSAIRRSAARRTSSSEKSGGWPGTRPTTKPCEREEAIGIGEKRPGFLHGLSAAPPSSARPPPSGV